MKRYIACLLCLLLVTPVSAASIVHKFSDVEITHFATIADLKAKGPWVDVRAYGAVGDGTTDDTSAFALAAAAANNGMLLIPKPASKYIVSDTITLTSGTTVIGIGRPLIETTSTTNPIFDAGAVSNLTISGLRLKGGGSDGAAGNEGLISINPTYASEASNVRIIDCEVSDFRNGISAMRVNGLWIERNTVHDFLLHGILASLSSNFHIDRNNVYDCDQDGGVIAYGIAASGDAANSMELSDSSISFNSIKNIPSWDGIMSHDASSLKIIGNSIDNVRTGIDVGHYAATNVVNDITIIGNRIKSTTTDTWSGSGAYHGGIGVVGYDNTAEISKAVVIGNIIDGFYNVPGLLPAGPFSNIVLSYVKSGVVSGNIVMDSGSVTSNAGVFISGTANDISITGNSLQGTMSQGGVRIYSATATSIHIGGNTISQDNTSDYGVYVTGSTIDSLSVASNATNCDAGGDFVESTSTISKYRPTKDCSVTFNPAALADGAGETTTVPCSVAALGDHVSVSFSNSLQGIAITGYVSEAGVVSVRFQNETGGTLNLDSGTLKVRLLYQ